MGKNCSVMLCSAPKHSMENRVADVFKIKCKTLTELFFYMGVVLSFVKFYIFHAVIRSMFVCLFVYK